MSTHDDVMDTHRAGPPGAWFSWREEMIVRALGRALTGEQVRGRLAVTFPSGRTEVFGRSGAKVGVALRSGTRNSR